MKQSQLLSCIIPIHVGGELQEVFSFRNQHATLTARLFTDELFGICVVNSFPFYRDEAQISDQKYVLCFFRWKWIDATRSLLEPFLAIILIDIFCWIFSFYREYLRRSLMVCQTFDDSIVEGSTFNVGKQCYRGTLFGNFVTDRVQFFISSTRLWGDDVQISLLQPGSTPFSENY